ncbi:Holliday junction resolvase RuvX [Kaarinaea lacus]
MTGSPRTILAFDFGTKRIGVAVGQELTKTATPLITLNYLSNNIDWDTINHLINEWRPDAFVVGIPLNADGSEHAVSRAAKQFGNQLQARYNLSTYWMDERLTSAEAESMIAGNRNSGKRKTMSRSKAKAEVDKTAAKLILESWFNQQSEIQDKSGE